MSVGIDAYIKVEYDPEFSGGNYDGIGRFEMIPLGEVGDTEDAVESAFERRTGLPRTCVVHWCSDELVDAGGEYVDA